MHTCDGCSYLASDGYTCLREQEADYSKSDKKSFSAIVTLICLSIVSVAIFVLGLMRCISQ